MEFEKCYDVKVTLKRKKKWEFRFFEELTKEQLDHTFQDFVQIIKKE